MSEQAAIPQPQPEVGIEPDDLDTKMIVAIGLISTFLLLASVLGVTALVDQFQSAETKAKVYNNAMAGGTYGDGAAVLAQQQQEIDGEVELASHPGVKLPPIDKVKQLVVEEMQSAGEAVAN